MSANLVFAQNPTTGYESTNSSVGYSGPASTTFPQSQDLTCPQNQFRFMSTCYPIGIQSFPNPTARCGHNGMMCPNVMCPANYNMNYVNDTTAFCVLGTKNTKILPPLQQISNGVSPDKVVCADGLTLMKRAYGNHSACVKPDTAQKLVQRGWGTILSQSTKPVSGNTSDGINNFAFTFFSNLIQQNKQDNVFFSPFSISDAFSMVYEGASGATKDEMQSVFGFVQDDNTRRNQIQQINSQLGNIQNQSYQLDVANALWIQNDYHILDQYTGILAKYYFANATNLDFKTNTENSRQTINTWVENHTSQKIKDLLSPGSINDLTRVVLTNAIYFKANWTNQFESYKTQNQNFTTPNGTVTIPMMNTLASFGYFEDGNLQVLDMPYQGSHLSMMVILPKGTGLETITGSLGIEKIQQWRQDMNLQMVQVYMPKFSLNTKYVLNDYLGKMGMPSAFIHDTADLSGISGKKDLYISAAIHQAFVKVDEKGTEAAAATGISVGTTAMPVYEHEFRADHPFVFLIYDDTTGLVLFLGQVTDPTK